MSFFKSGIIAAIVIVIVSYLAFVKELPFGDEGYTATATFENATTLRPTSPVRIAGVNVGKVTGVEPDGDGAKVTFSVDDEGLPIHDDATITIRPRLFLEGNFFLDLRPGSPSAPDLPDGGDIPVTQTATAVQLDEILTSLQQPDRRNLGKLLDGYSSALDDEPTAAEDKGQDPDVQGESAAQALNDSFVYGGRAGKSSSQVSQALLGTEAGDLSGLIDASGRVFEKLASQESELSSLITNFSITAGAFADESESLDATLRELAPTIEEARPSLAKLNSTFPPLRAFSVALTPGVKELPATIRAGTPWLRQTDKLLARSELGGLARQLQIATPKLTKSTVALRNFLPQLRDTSRCVTNVLVPTGDIVINDQFSTGEPNFNDFLYGVASQAGEGGNFDGNGQYLRVNAGGGPVLTSTPIGSDRTYGYNIEAPIGTQPLKPATNPPVRMDVPCADNAIANLNGPEAAIGDPSPEAVGP
jgi:ABC-type transporter Mla subunit MlaD